MNRFIAQLEPHQQIFAKERLLKTGILNITLKSLFQRIVFFSLWLVVPVGLILQDQMLSENAYKGLQYLISQSQQLSQQLGFSIPFKLSPYVAFELPSQIQNILAYYYVLYTVFNFIIMILIMLWLGTTTNALTERTRFPRPVGSYSDWLQKSDKIFDKHSTSMLNIGYLVSIKSFVLGAITFGLFVATGHFLLATFYLIPLVLFWICLYAGRDNVLAWYKSLTKEDIAVLKASTLNVFEKEVLDRMNRLDEDAFSSTFGSKAAAAKYYNGKEI